MSEHLGFEHMKHNFRNYKEQALVCLACLLEWLFLLSGDWWARAWSSEWSAAASFLVFHVCNAVLMKYLIEARSKVAINGLGVRQ